MSTITSTRSTENTTANSGVTSTETTQTKATGDGSFESILKGMVKPDGANQVSEEELFAGLVYERLKTSKGDEVAKKYSDALETQKSALVKGDGYIPMEEAAKNALKSLRADNSLTTEEADSVYSEAFDAAQLDSNTDLLYDGRGGAGDPTIAISLMESALSSAKMLIDKFTSGESTAKTRSLDGAGSTLLSQTSTGDASTVPLTNTPTGTTFDGADGFLFKPESSTDGKLAILMPQALAHQVLSLVLKDSSGNTLEEGRFTSYGDFGDRQKFAFNKSGQEYGKDITVHAMLADGTERQWTIPDPSQRYD